jgi:hypothetical protein
MTSRSSTKAEFTKDIVAADSWEKEISTMFEIAKALRISA